VRIRSSGPQLFLDVHILTDRGQTLTHTHKLTEVVEAAIRQEFPEADVIVHPEPAGKLKPAA
jgi:ferrous-iron efflux pump FieF